MRRQKTNTFAPCCPLGDRPRIPAGRLADHVAKPPHPTCHENTGEIVKKGPLKYVRIHRVDRVLRFFSSRRNGDSPTPSPPGDCAPPFGSREGGGATLACGNGGSPNYNEETYCTLWYSIYLYFVVEPMKNKRTI